MGGIEIMNMNSITFEKDRHHPNLEMEQWCSNFIGKGDWDYWNPDNLWSADFSFGRTTFQFNKEQHFTLFVLRWA